MPESPPSARAARAADWILTGGLAATLAWTTLCLGGYLAETMVWSSRAVVALAVLALARAAAGSSEEPVRISWLVLLPLPFLAYALGSVIWIAPARWLAWREWFLWLQGWVVFALAFHIGRSRGPMRLLAATFVLLALTGVAMAAYQRFVDPGWMMLGRRQTWTFEGRSAGSFGIPNSLAAQLELVLPLCLVLAVSRAVSLSAKLLSLWLAAAFAFALVLTGSRGGWIALGVGLLAWPLLGGGNWRRRAGGALAIAAVLAAAAAGLYRFSPAARTRIEPFLDGRLEASRPLIWKAGWDIWRTAPWLGTGAASYNVLFNQHRPRGFVDEPDWTHNEYLNTLGDYGVLGAALWLAPGVALLVVGWRAVRRARLAPAAGAGIFGLWRWRFGLWLGLVAFGAHLAVDFHLKIPALAFMAAICAAWLARDEPGGELSIRRGVLARLALLAAAAALPALWLVRADRMYRAESVRFEPRREINRLARAGDENFRPAIPPAVAAARRATAIDPANGQAWADLSYATALSAHLPGANRVLLGPLADQAARRALETCPLVAEFWVRRSVAEDMMGRRGEARKSLEQALKLAPHNGEYWFYLAYHLANSKGNETAAREALATCLSLDPGNRQGLALRERLQARNLRN
ncbi:MAG TPA: O-antigen ligase family protein [Opitutaceae bacterium]|nr:O-antigen ligase family protein [Opitutaceae bacterium]